MFVSACPGQLVNFIMKLSNVTIAVLLGLLSANASNLENPVQEDTNQIVNSQSITSLADIVRSQVPLTLAMEYMTVNEIWKLASLDPRIFLLANKTRPKVTEIAERFKMPALRKLKEHPDLALLEGYTFNDSKEDCIKKVRLLLEICENSLTDSPILATIQDALIDELVTMSESELQKVFHYYFFYDKIRIVSKHFYGLFKYESVLIPYLSDMLKNVEALSDERVASYFNSTRLEGFKNGPHGLKKLMKKYLKGVITVEQFVSKLPLPELHNEYLDVVIQVVMGEGGSKEYNDYDLNKFWELMIAIEEALSSRNLWNGDSDLKAKLDSSKLYCEFMLGKRDVEDVFLHLAEPEHYHFMEVFFIAFLRKNMFEAAANAIPYYSFSQQSADYVRSNAKFLKYLYETDQERLENVAEKVGLKGYTENSLYVLMARDDPFAKALLQPDAASYMAMRNKENKISFDGICEEELLKIYNNGEINPPDSRSVFPIILYNTSMKLFTIKLRTPEGREWIIAQFENNHFWKSELKSNHVAQLIYNMAKVDGSITKYLLPNCVSVDCDAVLRDLDDPVAFAQNKTALTDLFSLLKYFNKLWHSFPIDVLEGLNYQSRQRILELPGIDLDQIGKVVKRSSNGFANLQIVVMEMINREGTRSIFEKLNLPYPNSSAELHELINNVSDEFGLTDFNEQLGNKYLPHMNDYRNTVILLTIAMYRKQN